jgi:hypothetical protein
MATIPPGIIAVFGFDVAHKAPADPCRFGLRPALSQVDQPGSHRIATVRGIDPQKAIAYLVQRMPEYEEFLTFPDEAAALLHPSMGDLGRYYMAQVRGDPELTETYWSTVERLASEGDSAVVNAVHASLIEWFAFGDADEKAALFDAAPMQGPATQAMVGHYRQDP